MAKIKILFQSKDGMFGSAPNLVFVEIHNEEDRSISVGEWIADGDYKELVLDLEEINKQLGG